MNLSAVEFSNKAQGSNVVILDVRTAGEFGQGHIAEAINIDIQAETFFNKISSLDRNNTYAVYCRSGRRSEMAINEMQSMGFESLLHLEQGIEDWIAHELPVVV